MNFARSWGRAGIDVVNVFALQATNPKELVPHADPIGPRNRSAHEAARQRFLVGDSDLIVAAWGEETRGRRAAVAQTLESCTGVDLHCVGWTRTGDPKHPLFVLGDAGPERFVC
jgi:hypothetical protein